MTPRTAPSTDPATIPSAKRLSPIAVSGAATIWPMAVTRTAALRGVSARSEIRTIMATVRRKSRIEEPRRLEPVHPGVAATRTQQRVVVAVLDQQPVLDDDDAVRAADGGEPVAHD